MELIARRRAYKTQLNPTKEQIAQFTLHSDVARKAYNWALDQYNQRYNPETKKGPKIVGKAGESLKGEFTAIRKTAFPWMDGVNSYAYQSAFDDLQAAFSKFHSVMKQAKANQGMFKGRKPRKDGKPHGFPRFRSRFDGARFRLYCGIRATERTIKLPTIGEIKLQEKGYLPTDGVKIFNATISEEGGKWYVSLQVEEQVEAPEPRATPVVGVDLGIKTLATISDGRQFGNPKALEKAQKVLRRLQRSVSRKQKGSSNRAKAKEKVAKLHRKIANARNTTIHELTTSVSRSAGHIVLENLNVSGMMKNKRLARHIAGVAFFEIRRQFTYKQEWSGGTVQVVSRWLPSSKTCSSCGWVDEDLKLSNRTFVCEQCGMVIDRDLNAAINLKQAAQVTGDAQNACGEGSSEPSSVAPSEAGTRAQQQT